MYVVLNSHVHLKKENNQNLLDSSGDMGFILSYLSTYILKFKKFCSGNCEKRVHCKKNWLYIRITKSKLANVACSSAIRRKNIHFAGLCCSSFERGKQFKYLGTNLSNQNFIQEEIKTTLNSGKLAIIQCQIFCVPVSYKNY